MSGLGLIAGSSVLHATVPAGEWTEIQRHGEPYVLPHAIDHAANLRALLDAGCDRVLAIGSVGGLRPELGPGTFVCPHDFIALHLGTTALTGYPAHTVPGFDAEWRERVIAAFADLDYGLRARGVYWQAIGPRLETPAEIRLIATHADVIGMTVASECVIARELGLRYAAVCVVDNLANGVADTELTIADLERNRAANTAAVETALAVVLPRLAADA
jgi:5'-methylthioadenosine phosphorylase